MKKIIYDLGCYDGLNIPYYLLKADLVIAVDANPRACDLISNKFKKEIELNKLIVENCIITHEKSKIIENFYIFKNFEVASTIYPQTPLAFDNKKVEVSDYIKIKGISKNILDIIDDYGDPFYIKIDLEHYDHIILKEIFKNKIAPKYISAESHNIEVFNLMTSHDDYNHFKLSKGSGLSSEKYLIKDLLDREINYVFPPHSAGPFGEDIKEDWVEKDKFKFDFFLRGGPSWVDIHALRSD